MLQIKLKDKETQLQKLLLDLDETQKHCNELQQSTSNIIIRSEDKLCMLIFLNFATLVIKTVCS